MALERWLPYLDDEVTVHSDAGRARGTVSRWDPAVAVLARTEAPGGVAPGLRVRAHWRVGAQEHEGVATVEEVTALSWTVRLDGPHASPDFSRRREHRLPLSLPVTVAHAFSGSLGGDPAPARTLDISTSGMRVAVDAGTVRVGDVLEVRLEHEGRLETLVAYVVWEAPGPPGRRAAGLRFRDEVQLEVAALSR